MKNKLVYQKPQIVTTKMQFQLLFNEFSFEDLLANHSPDCNSHGCGPGTCAPYSYCEAGVCKC